MPCWNERIVDIAVQNKAVLYLNETVAISDLTLAPPPTPPPTPLFLFLPSVANLFSDLVIGMELDC